jgi:hypothetical protein
MTSLAWPATWSRARQVGFTLGICPVEDDGSATRAAAYLAQEAARDSGRRILLVEAPRRQSVLAPQFGLPAHVPGLGEMLAPPPHNRYDCLHRTYQPDLFLLPSGQATPPPPAEPWLARIVAPHFGAVVIEMPAMGLWRTPRSLPAVHAVLLVARPGCAGRRVERAVRRLRAHRAPLVACALVA